MFRWKTEIQLLARFLSSGVVNTFLGFAVIFALMAAGVQPFWANIAGYATGFFLGFVLSRNFVFRSNGRFVVQSLRYLMSFAMCFALNLLALQAGLQYMAAIPAQLVASAAYTVSMFCLARFWVYRDIP